MFRIPFFTTQRDSTRVAEYRRAKYGRHRFAVDSDHGQPSRKDLTVSLGDCLSSECDSVFIQEDNNKGSVNPSPVDKSVETSVRRPSHPCTCSRQKPAPLNRFIIIVAIIAFPAIFAATIGNFAFEIMSSTDSESALGLRLFTDEFDHFVGPRFHHSVEIGHINMEASFGFRSISASAHNVALVARSIPGLTSPLYSPPLHLDITRVDRTFWRSFSPRPAIHPPEMALSSSNNPGQCWAFAGYSGQLGIQLPAPVQVTSLVIEHTWDQTFVESAPRNVMLWGLVPTDRIDPKHAMRNTSSSPLQPQFGASHVGVLLASVVFDAIEGRPRQTYPLRHTAAYRSFDQLVVGILGNWGHPDYTCLYRLEIYGSESVSS